MKFQVVTIFILGIWVGYGLIRLRDLLPDMIKLSSFHGDQEKEALMNLTRSLGWRYWDHKNQSSLCFKNASLSMDDPVWLSLRWQQNPPLRIFYNRVPKTGSSVTLAVLKALSRQNKINKASSAVNILFNMSVPYQEVFVQSLFHYKTPLIYDRHLHFVNFESFGQPQPMYINTVREPISHFLSFYYYMRKMSMWKNRYTAEQRNMSLDTCLNASLYNCERHRQLRFFCGQNKICNSPDPPLGALQLAKRNIEHYYAVVGINEDLLGFFQILETFVPRYFRGAAAAYIKHRNDYKHFTTKKTQSPLKPVTEKILRELLKYDFDLYHFAKQRLHKQRCIRDHILRTTQTVLRTKTEPKAKAKS